MAEKNSDTVKQTDKAAKKAEKSAKKAEKSAEKAKKASSKKPNVFKRAIKYLASCKGEIKKITWPAPKQTTKSFGVVIAMVVIVGVFIFALDQGLYALIGLFMDTAS